MEHLPEPWHILDGQHFPEWDKVSGDIVDATGRVACVVPCMSDHPGNVHPVREATVRRIVAAINACCGLTTEVLEAIAEHGGNLATTEDALWQTYKAVKTQSQRKETE